MAHGEKPQGQRAFAHLETHLPETERQEALAACALARSELRRLVSVPAPQIGFRSCASLLVVVLMRPVLVRFLGTCFECCLPISEFHKALLAVGSIERASILLALVRFDIDQDGTMTDAEYRKYLEGGQRLLSDTVTTCANLGVVGALMIAATHLTTVGRPVPMRPSDSFVDEFGDDASRTVLWLTFASNTLTECLALFVVIGSVIGRLILTNIMPSLVSKIEFLAASNLNGNLVLCVIYLLCSLVNTIVFAAAMTSDSFTFVAVGLAPLTMMLVAGWSMPHYLKACLRVRLEAQQLLRLGETDVIDAPAKSGLMGRIRKLGRHHEMTEAEAATKMQSLFRGHHARYKHNEETAAATKMQSLFRGRNARHKQTEETVAATKMQSLFRGRNARHKQTEAKLEAEAAIKMQSLFRGHQSRFQQTEEARLQWLQYHLQAGKYEEARKLCVSEEETQMVGAAQSAFFLGGKAAGSKQATQDQGGHARGQYDPEGVPRHAGAPASAAPQRGGVRR
jgi:hypothetical protein